MKTVQHPGRKENAGNTRSNAPLTIPQAISPLRDGARILVVEDDDLSRRILIEELGKHFKNAEFIEASNGCEATGILEREGDRIDCMVLDFCLGDKPDEIHGEGVLAWMGENRVVCPTVVRSGSWSNPETVEARSQVTENTIRSIYSPEHTGKELRQLTAVPGLPVLVDFMGKGDNFDVLAARLDMVRLHSGKAGDKLGQALTPLEGVVGAIIHDILGGLDVGRREATPSRFNISRLDGSADDFFVYFKRFIMAAQALPEYSDPEFERLRTLAETVEQEQREKRFSFEALMQAVGSSHPNAHALLNRMLLCRDAVRAIGDGGSPLAVPAAEVSPRLDELYDGALTHYRASKRRVSGRVDVDAFMQASAAETAGLHGIAFDYSALWEPVGVSDVDSELLALAVTELSTNACKNAKKVSDGEPSAGVTWAIMSAGSIPANVKAFFDGASVNAEKFIMLVFTNNGELMSDEMIQALNRGDTSVLSESTSDSAGTGLRDLIENILPELPAAIFFERNDHHHTQDVQLFIPRSAKAASAGASSGAAARISKRRMAYVGGGVEALDEPAEERFATGKPRVIIVDDFRDFAEILEERIQGDMGDAVETVVCTSTAEFDAAAATAFDAVVSDYVLEAPHLKEAVEAERAGKSRTGRYVCRRAREINPNTLTILYSIDNVIDPDSPEGADASLHEHAPADPCFVNWGLNKGTHEITRSDGASFTRVTAESIGMPEGTPWFFVASRLVEEDLKTKQKI